MPANTASSGSTQPVPQTAAHSRLVRQAVTPMAFVQAIVLAYRSRTMDPAGALAAAQIEPAA